MKIESEYYGNWNEDGWWNVVEGISKTSESAPVLRCSQRFEEEMSRRAQNEWNRVCMKVYGGCSENYEGVRRNMEARRWHVVVEDVVKD